MAKYKLLKDLPVGKAGEIVYSDGNCVCYDKGSTIVNTGLAAYLLDNSPEWFEEIQEPTDSIHWNPQLDDTYWYLSNMGIVLKKTWILSPDDIRRHRIGNAYRTEEECAKACDRELAEVRLRLTSTFKPDFENRNGGWIVVYNYAYHKLFAENIRFEDAGEPVRYETREDAEKSIEENREDWMIYFGIKKDKEE